MLLKQGALQSFATEARVAVDLFRVDDRLIHGQVVVGWAQPMRARFIVLVDDIVAASEWEQDLYRMGAPAEMEVLFATVEGACSTLGALQQDERPGIVLTADVATMLRLHVCTPSFEEVNLGGIHTGPGRIPCLRYVFLSSTDERNLRELAARGVRITAQDLPSCAPTPLEELLQELRSQR